MFGPPDNLRNLRNLEDTLAANPAAAHSSVLTAMAGRASMALGIKYMTGDLIAQKAASGPGSTIDRERAYYFLGFGSYYGIINYCVFSGLHRFSPLGSPWAKATFSAWFDGCVHVPLSFYPQFYFLKECVFSSEERSLEEHFRAGLAKYMANWREDCIASAGVFVPLGILNFRFVPLVWRTPVLSVLGLIFPIVLSTQRGASLSSNKPKSPEPCGDRGLGGASA